jgi:TPR repeat protein
VLVSCTPKVDTLLMPISVSLAALLMVAALATVALAGPIEDASAAYGRGDYATALRMLRPLAEHGGAEAARALGFIYYNGQGVPQDYAEAVKWYRLAADQGVAAAQHDLGVMYLKGQGVPQNYVLAHMWFNLAASLIPASKKAEHDSAVNDRDLVESKMTAEQIAEAQKLARDWKPR